MAQKDYVSRGRSTGTRRKTNSRNKKRNSGSGVSKLMIMLAVAVLVTFIGGLWFLVNHKKEDTPIITDHKATGTGLPPKPEERWRYIKELENRQSTAPTPTEPSSGGEIKTQTQLTNEQRQLLEQMQADMRQQPTQLHEVPWNEQAPVQQQNRLQQQSRLQQPVQPPSVPQPRQPQPVQQPVPAPQQTQPPERVQQQPAPAKTVPVPPTPREREPARQDKIAVQPKAESKPNNVEKETSQRWMIQCGSFKGREQADSVRATLAFEGFESRVTTGGGWHRVVIGPYSNRAGADSTLKNLRSAGYSNCITLATGG